MLTHLHTAVAGLIALSFALAPTSSYAQSCTYTADPSSLTVGWTAFKTTQKTPVKGSFKKLAVHGKLTQKSLSALLQGLHVMVDLKSADTGNPARDKTLQDYFFSKLTGSVHTHVGKVSEKDHTFNMDLWLNGKSKTIPFHYELNEQGQFAATGTMDILEFGGNNALDSLHKQCENLHKGPDGVSKTWSEVDLNLGGSIKVSCQ
jgi:polyisoprenoid-binding protein YceI